MLINKLFKAYKHRRKERQDIEEAQAEIREINNAYHRLFNTDDGKFVLEHMVKRYMATPIAQQGDDLVTIGERQGRSNVVNEIFQRMESSQDN